MTSVRNADDKFRMFDHHNIVLMAMSLLDYNLEFLHEKILLNISILIKIYVVNDNHMMKDHWLMMNVLDKAVVIVELSEDLVLMIDFSLVIVEIDSASNIH
jgi:hypothetical protein